MRTRKMKRWLSILLAGLAAVILIAAAGGAFLFRHELKTLHSLKKVDDNVLYTMKYDEMCIRDRVYTIQCKGIGSHGHR